MPRIKEQGKTPEKNPNEMEISSFDKKKIQRKSHKDKVELRTLQQRENIKKKHMKNSHLNGKYIRI